MSELTFEEIKALPQAEQIRLACKGNAFLFGSNREIRRLAAEYLHEDEVVLQIVTGSRMDQRGRGIVVATDRRILFVWDGWVYRENQDFPYDTITSVEYKTGIFFGILKVHGHGDEVTYNWVGRVVGARFSKLARSYVSVSSLNPKHKQ